MLLSSLFKAMPDYSKTQMYKLHCNITGKDYYGQTTQTLEERKKQHTYEANNVKTKNLCTSKQIIDGGNWEMVWLEDYPCANKKEAEARERWWIENNECVNKHIPGRTMKEYYQDNKAKLLVKDKAYYQAHRDEILVKKKAYREANKEELSEKKKAYYIAHKEEKLAYRKAYREANKEEMAVKQKAYYQWNKSMDGLNRIEID